MPSAAASSRADVLIVGGGIMGCACAWELARRGVKVTVLERSVPGAEASSAAAGIVGAQIEARHAGPAVELGRASARRYPSWARALHDETGIDVEYRPCGSLSVAFERAAARRLGLESRWQRRRGFHVETLGAAALRRLEPALGPKLAGGVRFCDDARVDPRRLLKALHIAALRRDVEFRSGVYVRRVNVVSGRVHGIELEDGTLLRADRVVVAAGSWTTLIGGLDLPERAVVPARGQIVELTSSAPLFGHVVFGPDCYLVPRDDGRILLGSTLEFVGYRKQVTAQAVHRLLGAALELVPELGAASVSGFWSNFRPYTKDELPLLGPTEVSGLTLATGHYRSGILLAPITAEIVSALVRGAKPPLALEPFHPRRPPPSSQRGPAPSSQRRRERR